MTEVERIVRKATARALNLLADQLAAKALQETPMVTGTLRGSEVFPSNDLDGSHTATEDHLTSMVSFNTVYAQAQHEGEMTYERNGKEIHWVVKRHTEPGTKDHYLSDPYKALIPHMQPFIDAYVKQELDRAKLL
jgi:Minor capsid protein